jgi:hypothetical protein
LTISGTNCTALAALPITATCSPERSCSQFQRAEWNCVPPNPSSPGISGQASSLNIPSALTTTSASSVSPEASVSVQRARGSSQRAPRTSAPNRQ